MIRSLQRLVALALLLCSLAVAASPAQAAVEEAVFAGGCFWCLEHDLEHLPGVLEEIGRAHV